eukprot:GHRR01034267.1.p2 GENE.GHRR01034267.1~~GHRR01034267.1.p2  ORF type:complete len:256 (+),score=91.31 GHRR01034267.1:1329-2096(+)
MHRLQGRHRQPQSRSLHKAASSPPRPQQLYAAWPVSRTRHRLLEPAPQWHAQILSAVVALQLMHPLAGDARLLQQLLHTGPQQQQRFVSAAELLQPERFSVLDDDALSHLGVSTTIQVAEAPTAASSADSSSSGAASQQAAAASISAQSSVYIQEVAAGGSAGLPDVYRRLSPLPTSFPELPKLQEPKIFEEVLPNGLQVFLLEDREVPLTRGSLLVAGGQVSSPADKVGLASIAAAVQRAGGSRDHPAQYLDER